MKLDSLKHDRKETLSKSIGQPFGVNRLSSGMVEDAGRLGDKIGHRVERLTKATGTGMRRRRHRVSLAIAAIVAGAVAIIWFNPMDIRPPQAGAARTEAAVPVVAGQVEQINVPVYLIGIGTVQAFNSVVVKARVDGQIVKVDFAEGQDIHAGDVLAEIDPAPFAAALAQAEATRLKDMAQLDNARRDLARASRLAASGNATAQQFDTARSLVAQNEASLKADEAAVDAARIQLNYTKIRSPIDGRAGMRTLDRAISCMRTMPEVSSPSTRSIRFPSCSLCPRQRSPSCVKQ